MFVGLNRTLQSMYDWLTDELKEEIQKVFAPRYGRRLTEKEIVTIAENLTELIEGYAKFRWRKQYEEQNAPRI